MCFYRFKTKITEPSQEYQEWLSKQKSIQDIIDFANDFTYVGDKKQFGKTDYWQTPNEFFISKRGDCEDISLFIADAIYRAFGLNTYLLIAWRPFEAHAMAIYEQNGYCLVNYRQVVPMAKLKDTKAIKQAGFNRIKAVFKIPEGKKV